MYDEMDVDNALVRQKDNLIRLMNSGSLGTAQVIIQNNLELWRIHSYHYKSIELAERMANIANDESSYWHKDVDFFQDFLHTVRNYVPVS